MSRVNMLRNVALFAALSDEELAALAGSLGKRTFGKGMIIFHKGGLGQTLYIIESGKVRRVADVVPVDIELPGCPISKPEFEWLVRQLVMGVEPQFLRYPICVECKQRINTCVMDMGILCLGPVTRAGCNAVCPRNRAGCWGCRGPSEEANYESLVDPSGPRFLGDPHR